MFKRLFLLLFCVPLFWVGGDQAVDLIWRTPRGTDPTVLAGLRKDLESLSGAGKTEWTVRPAKVEMAIAFSEAPPPADLTEAEKAVAEPLQEYADRVRMAGLGLKILAGKSNAKLPKELKEFFVFKEEQAKVEDVETQIKTLLKKVHAVALRSKSADNPEADLTSLAARTKGLLSSKYFFDYGKKVGAFLDACREVLKLAREPVEETHFKKLDQLVAGVGASSLPEFHRLAQELARAWVEKVTPAKYEGDDEAMVFIKGKWHNFKLNRIRIQPEDTPLSTDWKLQFLEKRRWYVDPIGEYKPTCPTPKSLIGFAYYSLRQSPPLSPEMMHQFQANLEKEYQEKLKPYKDLPGSPLPGDLSGLKTQHPDIWARVQEIQARAGQYKNLFGAPPP